MKFLLLLTVAATILLVSVAGAGLTHDYDALRGHIGKRSVSESEPAAHAHSQNAYDGLHGGHAAGDAASRPAERERRATGKKPPTFVRMFGK